MENVKYIPKVKRKEERVVSLMRYMLFLYTFITFMFGLLLLAIGIWLAVDRNFMSTIIGNSLYAVSVYFILIGGCLIFFASFFGCCGVIRENKMMLMTFLIALIVISVILIIGGICAIVFKLQIGDHVKETMSSTLTDFYGFDYQLEYNRQVTDAWDMAQERLKCCGVSEKGWYIYRKSTWFKRFGSLTGRPIIYEDDENRPYVPRSCCVKNVAWEYINQGVCQRWRLGPPGSPQVGAVNRAIYYQGCYDAGFDYLSSNSLVLTGLGIAIGLFLIIGIVLSLLLLIKLKDESKA